MASSPSSRMPARLRHPSALMAGWQGTPGDPENTAVAPAAVATRLVRAPTLAQRLRRHGGAIAATATRLLATPRPCGASGALSRGARAYLTAAAPMRAPPPQARRSRRRRPPSVRVAGETPSGPRRRPTPGRAGLRHGRWRAYRRAASQPRIRGLVRRAAPPGPDSIPTPVGGSGAADAQKVLRSGGHPPDGTPRRLVVLKLIIAGGSRPDRHALAEGARRAGAQRRRAFGRAPTTGRPVAQSRRYHGVRAPGRAARTWRSKPTASNRRSTRGSACRPPDRLVRRRHRRLGVKRGSAVSYRAGMVRRYLSGAARHTRRTERRYRTRRGPGCGCGR